MARSKSEHPGSQTHFKSPYHKKTCKLTAYGPSYNVYPPSSDIKELAELAADLRMTYETCKEVYLWACDYIGCIPVAPYIRSMDSDVCDLDSYGIGMKGCKALAVSLIINTHITKLNLAYNAIGPNGTSCITYMLLENCFITNLILGMYDHVDPTEQLMTSHQLSDPQV